MDHFTAPSRSTLSMVRVENELVVIGIVISIFALFAYLVGVLYSFNWKNTLVAPYVQFAYASFFKSHEARAEDGQQSALESFYASQASVYDTTRKQLLRGREDMLALIASQLQSRLSVQNHEARRPAWFDIGGGTGYNLEVMDKLVGIDSFFSHVYLVDLSPSLCKIASQRVSRLGWKNVTILCQDARALQSYEASADLVTMSYSLSMIPDFYSVVDTLTGLLSHDGIFGLVDFYVQSVVDISTRNYIGGSFNRHVNWLGRMFWRAWFDADRVNLDAGRRDYVEYRFGTILSASERNYFLGGIPYYIFVGCRRDADSGDTKHREIIEKVDAAITESPYLSAKDFRQRQKEQTDDGNLRSKTYESAIINLNSNLPLPAAFYQKQPWRIHYNDLLHKHEQFNNEYIYAFNWEDPAVDHQLLNINKDDVILTITSAGDNILDYLLSNPKRVHAVDLNPNQNHLLELKVAAFSALPQTEIWKLFGDGVHPEFREILLHKLSPHLSSVAFQYWLAHASTFNPSVGLFETGGSRLAIKLCRWLFRLCGLTSKVKTMCAVETLNEQRELWPAMRKVLMSWPLHKLIVSSEWWAWKAAGVPPAQHKLILDDFAVRTNQPRGKNLGGEAIWQYVVDTLDPVVQSTQLSNDNYFYHLCLMGKYSKRCHPRYLSPKSHAKLSKPDAFDGLRIHTDELMEVIARITPATLTIAILMDSMDWFDPSSSAANNQVVALNKVLKVGGRVLFRSAALRPWYTDVFEEKGFSVKCVGRRVDGRCIDRVNMYASTWICTKTANISSNSSMSTSTKTTPNPSPFILGKVPSPQKTNALEELSI